MSSNFKIHNKSEVTPFIKYINVEKLNVKSEQQSEPVSYPSQSNILFNINGDLLYKGSDGTITVIANK